MAKPQENEFLFLELRLIYLWFVTNKPYSRQKWKQFIKSYPIKENKKLHNLDNQSDCMKYLILKGIFRAENLREDQMNTFYMTCNWICFSIWHLDKNYILRRKKKKEPDFIKIVHCEFKIRVKRVMKNKQNKHNVNFPPFYQIAQLAFELGSLQMSGYIFKNV